MLVHRFDYPTLSKSSVDGKRVYVTPTSGKLPSVTTILDRTQPKEKKEALQKWRNNVGVAKAKQITEEAASHGTSMHKKLEQYIKGELLAPGTNTIQQVTHLMAEEIIHKGLVNVQEVWGNEVSLYYTGLYAGTTDAAGIWKGNEAIIDFKQSNKIKKEEWIEDYYIQLAAYAMAHNHMFNTKIKTGVVMMCVRSSPPKYLEFDLTGAKYEKYENMWLDRVEAYYKLTA